MNIPTKEDLMRDWLYADPIFYQCLKMQRELGLADEEIYRACLGLMMARQQETDRLLRDALARAPAPVIIRR